jgi:TatD DNase family protein
MYFDSHTHVHFAAFKQDYRESIRRALGAGVGMITSGTQKDTSARAVEVAHEFENEPVFASVGLHPVHTEKSFHDMEELGGGEAAQAFTSRGEVFDYEFYKQLAHDPKVLAIGECGLDYYRIGEDDAKLEIIEKQKSAFIQQIRLAVEVDKPLVIHCRKAAADVIDILVSNLPPRTSNLSPGIVHFFTDGIDYAKQLADMGFAFSIGGVITFPPKAGRHAGDYDEMIKMLPMDRILTETDAPYVAPVPYRGKRNEPAYIVEVVKRLAEIRGLSVEKMKEIVWENTKRVFRSI